MKVPKILLLLFCIDAVGPSSVVDSATDISVPTPFGNLNSTSEATISRSAESHTASVPFPVTRGSDTSSPCGFRKDNYITLLMVAGGLTIACVILLVSTVMLALKVCQMSRRIKTSDAILITKSDCRANAAESTPETEAKETSILMNDIGQVGDGAPEEKDKHKDGQTGEEGGEKQAGNTASSPDALASGNRETPVGAAGSAASPTPQVGATDSPSTNATAAPSTEGLKESKEE